MNTLDRSAPAAGENTEFALTSAVHDGAVTVEADVAAIGLIESQGTADYAGRRPPHSRFALDINASSTTPADPGCQTVISKHGR